MRLCISLFVGFSCVLSACSSGSGGSSTGNAQTAMPIDTVLDSALNQDVDVQSKSASLNGSTGLVSTYMQDFTLRSREATDNGDPFRRIRYGKPRQSYHPKHNYTIPLSVTASGAQTIGTGTVTFTGDDVESSVASRTIKLTDVSQANSVFGIFSTDDTGNAPRQDFLEIHSYATGIAATNLPLMANYSGVFVANVISDGGAAPTEINLPANINVNFMGNVVSGSIGDMSNPDITLQGSINGATLTGTATVASGGVVLANGAAGTFEAGVYGNGAAEVAGTVGITDRSGATNHEMIGAFGGSRN